MMLIDISPRDNCEYNIFEYFLGLISRFSVLAYPYTEHLQKFKIPYYLDVYNLIRIIWSFYPMGLFHLNAPTNFFEENILMNLLLIKWIQFLPPLAKIKLIPGYSF